MEANLIYVFRKFGRIWQIGEHDLIQLEIKISIPVHRHFKNDDGTWRQDIKKWVDN